jgi:recombination protein RecR
MLKIAALEKLIFELGKLPSIGPRSAQRLAYAILKNPRRSLALRQALEEVEASVHLCPSCYNFTDLELCRYCSDTYRQDNLICVVEDPFDIHQIESSGAFRGRYHVLHGAISPLSGVRPEDLRISELLEKIERGLIGAGPAIGEVILAVDADLEGDTTVLYLAQKLQNKSVKITRIAQGVPIGSHINFVDDKTLGLALTQRTELAPWR